MKNPLIDLLRYHDFPELSAALRTRKAAILGRWEKVVQEALPGADELTRKDLRNSLPDALDGITESLASNSPKPLKDLITDSYNHGTCRFHQDFNLSDVMVEYNILRSIIIEEVSIELDRDLALQEITALNVGIDLSLRRGVIGFVNHQISAMRTAAEAQGKYLSFLSHDVRGGLNGVLLMTEILRRELASEPKLKDSLHDLDAMKRAILETVATMDRFLHAERFRKGKVKLTHTKLDFAAVLRDVANQFTYQAKDKGVELKVEAPPHCELVTDKDLATMILQNLTSNAVKYTPRGTVRVVAEDAEHEGKHGCRVSIIDQGPGIVPEQIETLFQPYVRGATHGQSGVGLGLSIAKQAADLLGATLSVNSELGKGARFDLFLPNLTANS